MKLTEDAGSTYEMGDRGEVARGGWRCCSSNGGRIDMLIDIWLRVGLLEIDGLCTELCGGC